MIVFPSNRSFSTCFELQSDSEGFADLNLIPFWFRAFDSVAETIASVTVGAVLVELLSWSLDSDLEVEASFVPEVVTFSCRSRIGLTRASFAH